MNELRRQYLQAMGITPWLLRGRAAGRVEDEAARSEPMAVDAPADQALTAGTAEIPVVEPVPPRGAAAPGSEVAALDWEALQVQVAACRQCALHETRTQAVFGVGDPDADWLIIGEAPGADEDRQGEPFVGRAGQLLNAMLAAVGLQRSDVYIANILKCRPPGNRDPNGGEVLQCEPYLARQIALIRPKLILALGRIAAQNLLKVDTPVGRLRGRVHEYGDGSIPLVVTYHPAYLLRSPEQKARAWQDLKLARDLAR